MIWRVEAVRELIYTGILIGINIIDPISVDWFCTKISQRKSGRAGYRVMALLGIIGYIVVQPFLLEVFAENVVISYIIQDIITALNYVYVITFYSISRRKAFILLAIRFFADSFAEGVLSFFGFLLLSVFNRDVITCVGTAAVECIGILNLYGLWKLNNKYKNVLDNRKCFYVLLLCFIIDIVTFESFYDAFNRGSSAVPILNMILVAFYELVIVCILLVIISLKYKEEEYNAKINFAKSQIAILTETQKEMAESQKVIHDMTNHLYTLKIMADKNMSHEIAQYIEKLIPEVKKGRVKDRTKSILSLILYEKKVKAKQLNVELEYEIHVDDIQIPILELSSIVNNVLDNAIEASEKVKSRKDRVVEFQVYIKDRNLIMECFNSYAIEPVINRDGKFVTSKTDMKKHGKGMEIIEDYVTHNKGDLDIRFSHGKFQTKIVFSSEIACVGEERERCY